MTGGVVVGGVLGGTEVGPDVGVTTEPVHSTPLSEKEAGFGLVPLHAPVKPIDVDAPCRAPAAYFCD